MNGVGNKDLAWVASLTFLWPPIFALDGSPRHSQPNIT
jgi:hypothetical protein